jgi:hypothetical protein
MCAPFALVDEHAALHDVAHEAVNKDELVGPLGQLRTFLDLNGGRAPTEGARRFGLLKAPNRHIIKAAAAAAPHTSSSSTTHKPSPSPTKKTPTHRTKK